MNMFIKGMASAAAVMIFAPTVALAADGKVTFNGEIITNTCTVISGDKDKIVTLPTVQVSALSAANQTAGTTPFTIGLENCATASDVSVYFEPNENVSTEGRLKNTIPAGGAANGANNVDIELLNNNHGVIDLANQTIDPASGKVTGGNSTVVTPVNGSATLPFYARYFATDEAEPGKVSSYVNFTIVYP
ncbi:TPA: type 1 fimbrial protein [Klebsiella pneumoniae]|uniref:fimbrial protein n=1 Tax=Klebsiella pneumoniae TaxID=573 RepID=UPI000E2B40F6|nr:fimbrial protein [Klebsiella pneumoniae]HBQ8815077.1 type 1 fimbrial protein [Klebsiella quasipneumoniae]HBR0926089.1 type 1 fimbrial protein [Klebsiella quasipneumoniae subsp. quasipneumoniae]SXU04743.1 fimbrial protein [Klebsiella pneumoniae]HBT3787520.1 type 1 fimbrial protein [Klebsiella pneumoniae]HBT3804329.1 type 1 fimbrial protein [Klebsiella pneumoniae]